MGKRNNNNGSQKKPGNATTKNDTKLDCSQETSIKETPVKETPVKETPAESTTADETTVMDNPMELIQKLQNCFQSQETDSNALRSEMRRLEDKLENIREQSQAEISGLNLVIKNLESNLESTREELQTINQAYTGLVEEYRDGVVKYEAEIRASKIEKGKLQATVKELKSVIQAGCITTEVLKQDFDKERLTHLSEMERLKATILGLQRQNISKDIKERPGLLYLDKSIPGGPTEVNANCENCALKSTQIKDLKIDLAVLSRSLPQYGVGILTGFLLDTYNGQTMISTVRLTSLQVERRKEWQYTLSEMLRARVSMQESGQLVSLPIC